jgi:hypothetical protein
VAGLMRSIGTAAARNVPATSARVSASTYQKQTSSEAATIVSTTTIPRPASDAVTASAAAAVMPGQ